MLAAEVDAHVEIPATDCDPKKPLLDAGHRLSLPGVVDTEVGELGRPSRTPAIDRSTQVFAFSQQLL